MLYQTTLFALLISFATAIACQSGEETEEATTDNDPTPTPDTIQRGASFAFDKQVAMTVEELVQAASDTSRYAATVKGTVEEVCQKKGCWMTLPRADGATMRITFKDYGFFVPKDISGKTAYVKGYAYMDTISVEMRRHFAEDTGASEGEITAITKPEVKLAFEAEGVVIE